MTIHPGLSAIVVFSLALLAGSESQASAQDRSMGLMVAAPALIGVDLPLSERIAMRPGIAFSHTSNASSTGSAFESSTTSFAFSMSAPLTVRQIEQTQFYVAPLFSAQRFTVSNDGPFEGTTSTLWSLGGAVGVQGNVATRLSVFGEAGFAWGWRSSSDDFAPDSRSSQTMAKLGVIFRLK